ncbi:MAG TPA: glucose-6-phosphate dehydrogenase assembly protein OpcA, partial [Mycobacteriales bacterium]|nr:glucose-6-phosphate dehydrogenase assembly protein OpcA [Mycobacteriales bacterium]
PPAAAIAAARHPLRLLMVIRRQLDAPVPRLDAEVTIGGRLGPGEAVVMRMYGRLALHSESVVLPLLAPDAPVVTWWHGPPPDALAYDPLGVIADRRVTDCLLAADPVAALFQRAEDYAPGDTDLTWTRVTPWRMHLAAAFDTVRSGISSANVQGHPNDPSALLLAGWLRARLGLSVPFEDSTVPTIRGVSVRFDDDSDLRAHRSDRRGMVIERSGAPASTVPMAERDLGDLLAEELRRLDVDQPYAEALSAATGRSGLLERSAHRDYIWRDPAVTGTQASAESPARMADGPTEPAG